MELSITLCTCLPLPGKQCDLACLQFASLHPGGAAWQEPGAEVPMSPCKLCKLGEILKGEAVLMSALLLGSCPARSISARCPHEVLTTQIYFWLQPPFPPQPQGQTGKLHYPSVLASASRMAPPSPFWQSAGQVLLSLPTPAHQAGSDCIQLQGRHRLKHLQIVWTTPRCLVAPILRGTGRQVQG